MTHSVCCCRHAAKYISDARCVANALPSLDIIITLVIFAKSFLFYEIILLFRCFLYAQLPVILLLLFERHYDCFAGGFWFTFQGAHWCTLFPDCFLGLTILSLLLIDLNWRWRCRYSLARHAIAITPPFIYLYCLIIKVRALIIRDATSSASRASRRFRCGEFLPISSSLLHWQFYFRCGEHMPCAFVGSVIAAWPPPFMLL